MVAEGGTQPPLQPAGQQLWAVLRVLAFVGSTRNHGPCQPLGAPSTGRHRAACGHREHVEPPHHVLVHALAGSQSCGTCHSLAALCSPQGGHAGAAGVAQQGGCLGCGQG